MVYLSEISHKKGMLLLFAFLFLGSFLTWSIITQAEEKVAPTRLPAQLNHNNQISWSSVPLSNTLFSDQTLNSGIILSRTQSYGANGYLGIGQAWGDYNRDGLVDLYTTDNLGANRLYKNLGGGIFELSEYSNLVALTNEQSGGASWADYDNDGWLDLFVANYGANYLFHNDAGAGFTDVTTTAGLGDIGKGETASWGDYDEDGYLDLYVTNWGYFCDDSGCDYHGKLPNAMLNNSDRLYHNNGDGTFTDVSHIFAISEIVGGGFVASFVDYDNDGDLDIYLVNDSWVNLTGNILWRNDGPGCNHWCFTNVSARSNTNQYVFGMGLATADYDLDGNLDFYFSSMGPSSMTLLQNQGDGTFADVSNISNTDIPTITIGWGAVFADFNNDGWPDLYVALMDMSPTHFTPPSLFLNNGDGTFSPLGMYQSGISNEMENMGVAVADYDNDGWLDLIIHDMFSGSYLFRNEGTLGTGNHWVQVQLEGAGSINKDAIGTRVYLTTADGRTQLQELKSGSSMGSGNELILHFGLGTSDIEQVRILWPDGTEEDVTSEIVVDQLNSFTYPVTMKQFFPLFLAK